jgi:hypothetical protein
MLTNYRTSLKRLLITIFIAALATSVQGQGSKAARAQSVTGPATVTASSKPRSETVINSRTFTATVTDDTLGTNVMVRVPSPVFTYRKLSEMSVLKITYQDNVTSRGAEMATCQYQVRVDGDQSDPGNLYDTITGKGPEGTAYTYQVKADARQSEVDNPEYTAPFLLASNVAGVSFSSTGLFRKVAAGPHEISIYQAQTGATQCIRNPLGFTTKIIVEEIE